jgi:outer membrane protein assembly factor BamB
MTKLYPLLLALLLLLARLAVGGETHETARRDWPTLHGDLVHSGYYSRFPAGPLELVWRKELYRELTGPRAEVIVADGLAFMGTYGGTMYAWDAATGDERWKFVTGGPIGHSPMWHDGVLYFASMDRRLYAVRASTGNKLWAFEADEGFWSSPVVAADLVMCGARDGVFYAVSVSTGEPAWKFTTGDRILTPASVTPDGKRVVFGSEDMHVYCLDAANGTQLWKSRKLHGLSLRDYAPTIVAQIAIVGTNPARGFHATLDPHQDFLIRRTGFTGQDKRYIPRADGGLEREQDSILAYLKDRPEEQTFYALGLEDGQEPWVAPILYNGGLHNPPTPPCFNPNTGDVFVFTRTAYGVWDGGGEVRPLVSPARLDVLTGRIELLDHSYAAKETGRPAGAKDMPWASFNAIGDETQALSCSDTTLFSNHQGFLGSLDLKSGKTQSLLGKRDTYVGFYGPGNFGWEKDGGVERALKAGEPFGIVNEWHGPGRSIASVAGEFVYYHTGSQILCFKAKQQ